MSNKDVRGEYDKVWDDRGTKQYGDFTDHPTRYSLKIIVGVIGGIVAFVVVISLIANAFGVVNVYWQAQQAKLTVEPRVTKATYGTSNALHFIAYFHDQCNTINSDNQQAANAASTLKNDQATLAGIPSSNPIAQQQAANSVQADQTNLLGVKDQLSNDVTDYDSKSATQTANPFKAAGLPYRISLNKNGLLKGSINCH